jgi:2-polyprenyl-3-methyl-5-hydroxy-6-metoxy-1,4-benzoquinol methylase
VATSNSIINKTMDIEDLKSDEARSIIKELNVLIEDLSKRGLKVSSWFGLIDETEEDQRLRALKEKQQRPRSRSAKPRRLMRLKRRLRRRAVRRKRRAVRRKLDLYDQLNRGHGYKPLEGAADDKKFPWFLYWEIVWVTLNSEFSEQDRVLDLGGSSSLFTYYLASKGLEVTTVELKRSLVDNANFVAQEMGWNLRNYVMDMRDLTFTSQFDHITSICVFEHIPMYDRVEINKNVRDLLVQGGRFSITFDYKNPSRWARINSPQDIYDQFISPSGLAIRGNQQFVDTGKDYLLQSFHHPRLPWRYKFSEIRESHFAPWELFAKKYTNDYTFGALFLEKPQN